MDTGRPRVLVYTSFAVVPSYRFVIQPFEYMTRWDPVILCAARAPGGLDVGDQEVVTLDPPAPRALWWGARRLRGLMRWPAASDVRRVKAAGARVLHAHFGTDGVLVAPLARAAGLPLVVTLHGYDIQQREGYWRSGAAGWWHRDYLDRLRRIGREGAHFVAVSRAVAARAVEEGLPEARVHVQPIGIDTRAFSPGPTPMADRPPRVVFVGNHIPRKGGDVLIRAMARVRDAVPDATLDLVGDGSEAETWRALAASLGVPTTLHGRLPPAGVREVLNDAVALVLPSTLQGRWDAGPPEGFGLVVVEAAAMGLPVVTSAQGLDSEGVLEGETGFAIAPGDGTALADRLTRLLTDRQLATRMGAAAPGFVREHYDLRTCTAGLEALYDRVAREGATGSVGA